LSTPVVQPLFTDVLHCPFVADCCVEHSHPVCVFIKISFVLQFEKREDNVNCIQPIDLSDFTVNTCPCGHPVVKTVESTYVLHCTTPFTILDIT